MLAITHKVRKLMPYFSIVAFTAMLMVSAVHASEFEQGTVTVVASEILGTDMLKGEHYTIAESVTVDGYMNHYTVDSEFGQFAAVGDRALKILVHEIDAIAELKKMTSTGTGTDAVVGVVADTGKSVANLVINPIDSAKGISAGVSRFFKRTSRKAKNAGSAVAETVSGDEKDTETGEVTDADTVTDEDAGTDTETVTDEDAGADTDTATVTDADAGTDSGDTTGEEQDEPGMTSKMASSFMGIGKAHRELARDLKVDPYSDNAVLQTELNRVAQVAGSVGKVTKILIPIPSIVGTAASVNDMVWSLSPMDLLIQNEEKLEAMGYTDEQIEAFFSNEVLSPSERTAFVAALESLDTAKGKEVLLNIVNSTESQVEGEFVVRSALFAQLYHQNVEPITGFIAPPEGLVPVAITESENGLVLAPVDHLLWTEEVAAAADRLGKLIDDHGTTGENLMWVDGRVSDIALVGLNATGWVESPETFEKLEVMIKD